MKLVEVVLILQAIGLSHATADDDDFARAARSFGAAFYTRLSEANPNENFIFSPLSIYETLGMLLAGADGNTKVELKQTMKLNQTYGDRSIHSQMAKLYMKTTIQNKGQELIMENAMFSNYNFDILDTYLSTLIYKYKAYHQKINMTNHQATIRRINDWVDQATKGKITNLIQTIPKFVQLILVNAIYFNGTWKHPFQKVDNTVKIQMLPESSDQMSVQQIPIYVLIQTIHKLPMSFTLPNGRRKNITYMVITESFPYWIVADIQFLAIPYISPTTSYFVIGLPFSGVNLSSLNERAVEILWSLPPVEEWPKERQIVKMPKFQIEKNINVKQVLKQMGIHDLFNSNSQLNGISPMPLQVSQFVHKAYIKVHEKGTEAAAASAAILGARSVELSPEFNVNQPFFFAIYNKQAKVFTFMGKINDPED